MVSNVIEHNVLTDLDVYLFKAGKHFKLYEKLGSHLMKVAEKAGTHFSVWAPNAHGVFVMGDFNGWDTKKHPLKKHEASGIWQGFVEGVGLGSLYKYHIVSKYNNYQTDKGDPFAFKWQIPPSTASIVWDLNYEWHDDSWREEREKNNLLNKPLSAYEVHVGSWKRILEEENRSLTYKELGEQLSNYVDDIKFTHVEFLPVMEHPFYGSWGYQTTGYFAPSSRFGNPQDFMYAIDQLHKRKVGVILDWVPSHFPSDNHGLVFFDGTHLYEYEDKQKQYHPDWKSYIFDYGKNEVRSFLISSAMFWLDKYHADGLRVDGVASMLYLDYSRKDGEWIPNKYGGRENLEAVDFLKELNKAAYSLNPGIQMIAEESTSWPMVSKPTDGGGLGFGMKWKMGWMNDTLNYFSKDPIYRSHDQSMITFSMWYAYAENFILALSHDEVVYGKGSLIRKMPGDNWQKFANLRLLLSYMYTHPGKKLLFMGQEIGQWDEWSHEKSIQWDLLQFDTHKGVQNLLRDLNVLYRSEPSLHELDFSQDGFEWVDMQDTAQSVVSYLRKSKDVILVVLNFTPITRQNYRLGVPKKGVWKEIFNSDAKNYGGSGQGNLGKVDSTPIGMHNRRHSITATLPPLGAVFFKWELS